MKCYVCTILAVFTLLTFQGTSSYARHALYISVIEIEHASGSNKATLRVKVFSDDLRESLYMMTRKRINSDSLTCHHKGTLERYFEDHMSFKINKTTQRLVNPSCELLDDSTWLYFTIDVPENWEVVEINADYFTELFPTQSNMVIITNDDQRRFARLSLGAAKASFLF